MIQIAGARRLLAGGMVAGFVGVALACAATVSADPMVPQPAVPAQPGVPPVQNSTVYPGGINRFAQAPAQAPVQAPLQAPAQAPFQAPAQAPLVAQPPAGIASPSPAAVPAGQPGTAPVAAPPAVAPAVTGTLRDYLQSKGVRLEAQRPQGFTALQITMPVPPRWTQVPDPNVPDAFAVIADRVGGASVYTSNAQLVVYKLVGDFDPAEAITHGFLDSQQMLAWQTTNASLANHGGFPSSIIEGTYRENDMTLNTSRRHVIATAGPDKYLVTLSVTTAASQAVSDAPATDAIVNGFRVAVPGAPAQAPPAPQALQAPQAPARVAAPAVPAAQAPVPAAPAVTQPAPQAVPGQLPATSPRPAPAQPAAAPPLVALAPSR